MSGGNEFGFSVRDKLNKIDERVVHETFLAPATASTTNIKSATDISSGTLSLAAGDLTLTVLIHPRNIVITTSDNASNDLVGTVTVTGTNQFNETATETFTIVAETDTYTGSVAWISLTTVVGTFTTAAASDTLSIGTGNKLGLSQKFRAATDVFKGIANAALQAPTGNATYYTATFSTTPDGSKNFEVWYTSNQLSSNVYHG